MLSVRAIKDKILKWAWRLGEDEKIATGDWPDTIGRGGMSKKEMQRRIKQADKFLYGKYKK